MHISELTTKMVQYSNADRHNINHFMKVYAYAKTIGECERLDSETQAILEVAAVLHDIGRPLCLEKYGHTQGPYQEAEGAILAGEFLRDAGYSDAFIERVVFLVGHHHTLTNITGLDYQILIEADYLVNADEGNHSEEKIRHTMAHVFKTPTGILLLKAIFGLA